jgi:hypothetical protein
VPVELDQIVVRCLNKDPEQRFQSMQEIRAALDSGAPSPPTMRTIVPLPAPAPRRSSKTLSAIALFVVVAAAAGAGYWWTIGRGFAPPLPVKAPPAAAPSPDGTMTNDTVIAMARESVPPSVIVSQIRARKTNFDLSDGEVIRLSKAGVPPDVIEAMRNPEAQPPPATPLTVDDGLQIRLTLAEDIPSAAAPGDAVRFTVTRTLRVGGTDVVLAGAPAIGSIVDSAKKRFWVLGSKMTFSLQTVDAVGGAKITLRATPGRNADGPSKRALSGGGKRKDIAAAAGSEFTGYVDGLQTVLVKN